jgi:hypothetical protein
MQRLRLWLRVRRDRPGSSASRVWRLSVIDPLGRVAQARAEELGSALPVESFLGRS